MQTQGVVSLAENSWPWLGIIAAAPHPRFPKSKGQAWAWQVTAKATVFHPISGPLPGLELELREGAAAWTIELL